MKLTTIDIIQRIFEALKVINKNVFLNKQWFDCRDDIYLPSLSLFILEETPLDSKGTCFKQELSGHMEGLIDSKSPEDIYLLANKIKKALLQTNLAISYQGYEINLPEDGARVARVQVKFKVVYLENIE